MFSFRRKKKIKLQIVCSRLMLPTVNTLTLKRFIIRNKKATILINGKKHLIVCNGFNKSTISPLYVCNEEDTKVYLMVQSRVNEHVL